MERGYQPFRRGRGRLHVRVRAGAWGRTAAFFRTPPSPPRLLTRSPQNAEKEPQKAAVRQRKTLLEPEKRQTEPLPSQSRPQTAAYDGRRVQMRTTLYPQCIKAALRRPTAQIPYL